MNTAINIKSVVDQIVSTFHEPAINVWRIALLQNRVNIYVDVVEVLFLVVMLYIGYLAFKQHDPRQMTIYSFPAWLTIAGTAWVGSSILILMTLCDIIQRVINPEWSAACDIINALHGNS